MKIITFAAIYIGTYEVSMKISEISSKKGIKEVDNIRSRIGLGRNIYNYKKIDAPVMEELCDILSEYHRIMEGYGVDAYEVCAGSFLKEANNALFLLEQIRVHTGFSVKILSNSERRYMGYQSVAEMPEFDKIISKGAVVVDVGGESTQITLFEDSNVISSQRINLGTVRLREQLSGIEQNGRHYVKQMEELVYKEIETYISMYLKERKMKYLLLVGDYSMGFMNALQKNDKSVQSDTKEFVSYLKKIKRTDIEEYAEQIGVWTSDELIMPAVIIYRCIAERFGTKTTVVSGNTIGIGMTYQYIREHKLMALKHNFEENILTAAKSLSLRYSSYSPHIDALVGMSGLIFDAMKKIHGLGKRERLLLQVAAILHDCGKYISIVNGAECSYGIITSTEIIGLSHMEREIIANAVKYHTRPIVPYEQLIDKMDVESYMVMAKLAAILRVANALDRSHKQKFKTIKLTLKEKELVITVESEDDILLEKGLLEHRSDSFRAIFGITPILREKRKF